MIDSKETSLLRELAKQYAEIASQPVNTERKQRAKGINSLRPARPTVWIHEIPWHEMDIDSQLLLHCTDPKAREMEWFFRSNLFRWKYFQADMVAEPFYTVNKSWSTTGVGIEAQEEVRVTDDRNNIISHSYGDQLDTEEKLEALHNPILSADKAADQANVAFAREIFGDILSVKLRGSIIYYAPWDRISRYRGVEPILIDILDRPEFIHATMKRFTEFGLSTIDQMEKLDLLEYDSADLHCTPAWVDELPAPDYDSGHIRLKDVWLRSMAQMFSSASPAMQEEFDVEYLRPLAERCGLVYYGCCEPLHDRLDILKKIPNMRKIGVSSWADVRRSAEEIGGSYVYSRKPNPAMVAGTVDEDAVRKETRETVEACLKYGCPYELVLKDISTVGGKPENLILWNKLVQEIIDEYY